MMEIRVENGGMERLRTLDAHANRVLRATVIEGSEYADRRMSEIVPHGRRQPGLNDAISALPLTVIAPGHYRGGVWADPAIAPHAGLVDRGTGVDGPFHQPVTLLGPTLTGRRRVMRFQKEGEPVRFRPVVKFRHSSKIERGKNFSGRTYESLNHWAALQRQVIAARLADHFR